MTMKHSLIVLVLFLIIPVSSRAEFFPNHFITDDHFAINLPWGWEPVPENILKQFSQSLYYHYAYQESPGGLWFNNTPFILIHVSSDQRINESKFRDVDSMTKHINHEIQEYTYARDFSIIDHDVSDAFYDDENNIFYSTLTMKGDSGRNTYILMASLLTESGYIEFSCYLGEHHDFDEYDAVFKNIIDHIELDNSIRYHPRFSDHFLFISAMRNKLKSFQKPKFAIILLLCCLFIWRMRTKYKS